MPDAPRRILVICLRRIGDVLLATPLIRSLKRAYPQAAVDALVFAGTEGVLHGNPDLHRVHRWPQRGSLADSRKVMAPLFRSYQLALALQPSDRAHYAALWAAPRRAVILAHGDGFKRRLARWSVVHDPARLHTVVQHLQLADALGIPRCAEVVPPLLASPDGSAAAVWKAGPQDYAVVHPAPMYRYKAWPDDHWRQLVAWLQRRGLRVAITGGPAGAERAAAAQLVAASGGASDALIDLSGQLQFGELSGLIGAARLFVGPDTSVTHLAAATGTPTLALFGPSSPVTWGPWPCRVEVSGDSPWRLRAPVQQRGNVWLLQGTIGRFPDCIPCLQEGCERHADSASDCLVNLSAATVFAAAEQALARSFSGDSVSRLSV